MSATTAEKPVEKAAEKAPETGVEVEGATDAVTDPYAAVEQATVLTLKASQTVDDIPLSLRKMVEDSLTAGDVRRIGPMPGDSDNVNKMIKDLRKYMTLYATIRTAGPLSIRVTVQPDGKSVSIKASEKPNQMIKDTEGADKAAEVIAEKAVTAEDKKAATDEVAKTPAKPGPKGK